MAAIFGDDDVLESIKRALEHRSQQPTDKLPKQPPLYDGRGRVPPDRPAMDYPKTEPMKPPRPAPPGRLPWWARVGGQVAIFIGGAVWLLDRDAQPPPPPPGHPGAKFKGWDGDPNGAQAPFEVWELPDGTVVRRNPVNGELRWPVGLQPKRRP